MGFELEARDPFLTPKVGDYALNRRDRELVQLVNGQARGKAPLRSLYDLHPDALPEVIRDRQKMAFSEGAGFDVSEDESTWKSFAEATISDREFADGKKRFAAFDLWSKEEFLYLDTLATTLDVSRVPHLSARTRLRLPQVVIDDWKRLTKESSPHAPGYRGGRLPDANFFW